MVDPDIYECEIKILGNVDNLQKALDRFIKSSKVVSDSCYDFSTRYFDDSKGTMYKQGFSLRWRDKQGKYKPCFELKQIEGEQQGVSKRIEISIRRDDVSNMLSLYFSMLANPNLPENVSIPYFNQLEEIYEIKAKRREVCGIVVVNGVSVVMEAALDDIEYIKDGQFVDREFELEFELKDCSIGLEAVLQFVKDCVVKDLDVCFTTQSKASRLRHKLVDKKLKIA